MVRSLSALAAVAAALSCAIPAFAQSPFGALRIGVNRSKYVGGCPVEVIFTGNINMNLPHPKGFTFQYHWERSDGAKGPIQVVHPDAGKGMLVVKEPWTLGASGTRQDIWVKLFVASGNTHLEQQSQAVSITCK
jgi:hypothetical protein